MSKIYEPAREIPVSHECDVLICGGGIAGISAALAAARNGAKVLLIEREFMLGGLATLGLITIYLPLCDGLGTQVSYGIAHELLKLSMSRVVEDKYPKPWVENGSLEEKKNRRYEVQYNPHIFACDCESLLADAGVELLYGTVATSTVVEESKITAVIVENKSGRSAIRAKSVVDCTGDADICHLAGAKTALHAKGNVLAAWYYRFTDGEVKLNLLGASDTPNATDSSHLVPTRFSGVDADEISGMVQLAHKKSLENVLARREKDGTSLPVTFPTIPQLRMTRKLVGIATPDSTPTHKFEETSVGLYSDWRKAEPVWELPFGALYGAEVKNLITAGRNISVTDSLWDVTRVIPVCAVSGEAAGTAAAMSDDFANLDVKSLQSRLAAAGVKLHCPEVGLDNRG